MFTPDIARLLFGEADYYLAEMLRRFGALFSQSPRPMANLNLLQERIIFAADLTAELSVLFRLK
jgi:hypothetical protein